MVRWRSRIQQVMRFLEFYLDVAPQLVLLFAPDLFSQRELLARYPFFTTCNERSSNTQIP
jgi:hypothetical protein